LLISNFYNEESVIEVINIGWLYSSSYTENIDFSKRKIVLEKVRKILGEISFSISSDCKRSFLYQLLFYINTKDNQSVNTIFNQLISQAVINENSIHWLYCKSDGQEYINWGASHGILGIAGLIAKAIENGVVEREQYCPILKKIINGYINSEYYKESIDTLEKKQINYFSHFGYCYGHLTGLIILYRCSKVLFDKKLEDDVTMEVMKLSKIEPKLCDFEYHFLCHGYTGVALVFYYWYLLKGDKWFLNVSKKWLHLTENEFIKHEYSIEIFNKFNDEFNKSLLFGSTGILLAQKNIIMENEIPWIDLLGL